jgi:hypothetical protein
VFAHVTGDHDFKDDYLFYRFSALKTVAIIGGGFAGSMLGSFRADCVEKRCLIGFGGPQRNDSRPNLM